jgi:small subunit ribosomal protein S16
VDTLGYYDPRPETPSVRIDLEKYQKWVDDGAHPSDTVKSLARRAKMAAPPGAAGP